VTTPQKVKYKPFNKAQWALLVAAWTRNEIDKRLAWLSPTYTEWNPKLPWGTQDYDPANARVENYRRWNWVTDGTPNKWLNCPYEFPWNSAAGQLSLPFTLGGYHMNGSVWPLESQFGIATPDVAIWNPKSYESRPAPPEAAHVKKETDADTVKAYERPDILRESYETIVMRKLVCTHGFPPNDRREEFTVPEVVTRYKGAVYDQYNNYTWPEVTKPDGTTAHPEGTVYNWGQEYELITKYKYNERTKQVFLGGRLTAGTVRWNLIDESWSSDDRRMTKQHYEDKTVRTVAHHAYSCDYVHGFGIETHQQEGSATSYFTRSREIPSGMLITHTISFTDEFKYGSYQKKEAYPCYMKPSVGSTSYLGGGSGDGVIGAFGRNTNLNAVPGAEVSSDGYYWPSGFVDYKPEWNGSGNVVVEVDEDQNANNTWYSKWSYKPSQHWADGWGIRCESTNFYYSPEYRIGTIFTDEGSLGNAEADPMTDGYNAFFWEGMHREIYPIFKPGGYWGTKTTGEDGFPRTPDVPPNDNEDFFAYLTRTNTLNTYDINRAVNNNYGFWFTMPVLHYSANDLYKNLCHQEGFVFHPERPDEVVAALRAVNIPGQPDMLAPPTRPTATLLDTTYLFNQNCLVPTDWVHASMQPLPVVITALDANNATVSTNVAGYEKNVFYDVKPIVGPNGDVERFEYVIRFNPSDLLKGNGAAAVPPVINYTVTPAPPVRPAFATLANYPTGWEVKEPFYSTIKSRLAGETEMNHRCENIPNWLDPDGGLLFYFQRGRIETTPGNYVEKSYFHFIKQVRLPFWNRQDCGMTVTVELLFRKLVNTSRFEEIERTQSYKQEYSVVRKTVELKWPDSDENKPDFDNNFTPADTNPDRSQSEPSVTPSVWKGESTLPRYTIKTYDKGQEKTGGKMEDKRDWQAFGPSTEESVFEIVTAEGKTEAGERTVWYSYAKNENIYHPGANPYSSDPADWGTWENKDGTVSIDGYSASGSTDTTLELIDVKIIKINGSVFRATKNGGVPA
jgi:hypothetical protein